ncbi:hypothetical protein [Magnetospirillum sulfuroxidans]|uniref:Calcium-mediated lectin domain-containing protein n=1 Tax=Magnetospirillum sulfuroxidans TaxID=611300 RepID=A0ABS5IB08_9PROT|nr:hypothetical protein [Magnetospirillum sulfuroxidans]MBR9971606.1 hypothetical protein [Magnetospirillum sulfuroxidans]
MSVGPVSGNGIAITLAPGKTVFWTVTAQAAYTQFVQLKDTNGTVVFTATGSGGTGGTPNQIGQGHFVVPNNANYTMYIGTNNGAQWSSVIWDADALVYGGTVYYQTFNFISEDGGGTDYNDSAVTLSYFNSLG